MVGHWSQPCTTARTSIRNPNSQPQAYSCSAKHSGVGEKREGRDGRSPGVLDSTVIHGIHAVYSLQGARSVVKESHSHDTAVCGLHCSCPPHVDLPHVQAAHCQRQYCQVQHKQVCKLQYALAGPWQANLSCMQVRTLLVTHPTTACHALAPVACNDTICYSQQPA